MNQNTSTHKHVALVDGKHVHFSHVCSWCRHSVNPETNAPMRLIPDSMWHLYKDHGICSTCKEELLSMTYVERERVQLKQQILFLAPGGAQATSRESDEVKGIIDSGQFDVEDKSAYCVLRDMVCRTGRGQYTHAVQASRFDMVYIDSKHPERHEVHLNSLCGSKGRSYQMLFHRVENGVNSVDCPTCKRIVERGALGMAPRGTLKVVAAKQAPREESPRRQADRHIKEIDKYIDRIVKNSAQVYNPYKDDIERDAEAIRERILLISTVLGSFTPEDAPITSEGM